MRAAGITMVINWNFLFFRYVIFDWDDRLTEGLIFQMPWWDLHSAFTRGYLVKLMG